MGQCEKEAETFDSALKEFARAAADARDITHLCEVHGERCEDMERYERDELEASNTLYRELMSLVKCVEKRK